MNAGSSEAPLSVGKASCTQSVHTPTLSLPAQLCPSACSTQPAPHEHCTPQWVSAHVSAQPPLRTKQLRPAGMQQRSETMQDHFCSSPGPTPAHHTCWAHRCRPGSHPHRCTSETPGCTSPRRTSPCRLGRGLRHTQLMSGGQSNARWALEKLWVPASWGGPTKCLQLTGMPATILRGAGAREGKKLHVYPGQVSPHQGAPCVPTYHRRLHPRNRRSRRPRCTSTRP